MLPTHRPVMLVARNSMLAVLLALFALGACGGDTPTPRLAASEKPKVRVLLQRRAPRTVLGLDAEGWEMVSGGGHPFVRRGTDATEVTLGVGRRGIALGTEDTGATVLRVRGRRHVAVNGTRYPGEVVVHVKGGEVRCVNETDLETYLAGVIPNEMAPGAPPAAYRAQAVAARTYAWIKIQEPGSRERIFDVYDDQASQVYTGLDPRYDVAYAPMVRHVADTYGVILTWQSQPFPAYYSSTCGGHTTDPATSQLESGGADVVLRGVRCGFCEESSRYAWTKTVTEQDVVAGLERRRRPIAPPVHAMAVTKKGAGGWAAEVTIVHGRDRKEKVLPGTEFRSALRLDSHHVLAVRKVAGGWEIQGRGWGHGVGFCQMGGVGMARKGLSESEILTWYYPGAVLTRVY